MISKRFLLAGGCLLLPVPGLAAEVVSAEIQATVKPSDPTAIAVDLKDATQIALTKSSKLRQAEAEHAAAVEHRRGSWAEVGPRVSGDAKVVKFPNSIPPAPSGANPLIRPELNRSASITVAQPITGAYALVTKAEFDGKQEDIKDLSSKQTRSDVAFEAADTWLKAYEMQRQLEIAEFAVQVATSQANDAEAMERAGRLNHAETLRLKLAISEARSNVAKARAGRDTVFAALREALGLPFSEKLALKGDLPKVAPPPALEKALGDATQSRMELKMAEKGLQVARFGKKLAYAEYIPTVNVFAKLEHNWDPSAFNNEKWTRSYGVNATWDLWSNGSSAFAVREAAHSEIAAEEGLQSAEKMIRLDVQQALANLAAAGEALAAAESGVSQAEEVYRIQSVRFKTGAILSSDLLAAETARESAKARLVSAQTDLVAWNLKSQKALGLEQPQF